MICKNKEMEIVPYIAITDVLKCARCGKDHKNVLIYDLLNPTDNRKYFATCPETGQPLFIEVI